MNGGARKDPNPAPDYTKVNTCSNCPGPVGGGETPFSFPVAVTDLVQGTNTLEFSIDGTFNSYPPILANIDLLTFGGPTPSNTPVPSATGIPTPSPTPLPTPTITPTPLPSSLPTLTPPPGNITTIDDSVVGTGLIQFNYQGANWGHCTNCGAELFNGSNSWDSTAGETVTIQFNGQQASIYGVKDPSEGMGAFSVDGGAETLVNFFASTRAGNQLMWTTTVLSSGTHTLKLRVTGTLSGGTTAFVTADRVDVITNVTGTANPTPTTPPPTPIPTGKVGDINGDGKIDIFDYNLLVGNFGKSGISIQGDLNNDNTVNIFDYNLLVGNFGK